MNGQPVVGASLAELTTLKTGGQATYCITVTTLEELKAAVIFAQQMSLPFFVIGGGSNLLAPDSGYAGVIIKMNIMGRVYRQSQGGIIEAVFGAGEILDDSIHDTVRLGYWGLENLSHIPGTVGATPIQNVGAYGVEVSELIKTVEVYDTEEQCAVQFTNAECQFAYRDSRFKTKAAKRYIITAVTFTLNIIPTPRLSYASLQTELSGNEVTQADIRTKIIAIRSTKFPDWHIVGTAGSFFKNPIIDTLQAERLLQVYPEIPTYYVDENHTKVLLGYILDKVCGLRGYKRGHVHLHAAQALVLVAEAGATTQAIEEFAAEVHNHVLEKTNISIEPEVTKIV